MPHRRLLILPPDPAAADAGPAAMIAEGLAARGHSVRFAAAGRDGLGDAVARSGAEAALVFGARAGLRLLASHLARPPLPVVLRLPAGPGATAGAFGAAALPLLTLLAARTLVATDAERRALIRRAFVPSRRVLVVPDPVAAVPVTATSPSDADVVAAFGEAGADTLCRALAAMRRPALLRAAGAGEPLLRAARRHGVSERIEIAGTLDGALADARVFVHAAAGPAALAPLVTALGRGVALVATRSGGPEEVLAEGRYGRIVPPGDAAALALALDAALDDPGDPVPRRARALDYAPDAIAARFEATIEAVLRQRAR